MRICVLPLPHLCSMLHGPVHLAVYIYLAVCVYIHIWLCVYIYTVIEPDLSPIVAWRQVMAALGALWMQGGPFECFGTLASAQCSSVHDARPAKP